MTDGNVIARPGTILVVDYERRFIWFEEGRGFTSSVAEGVIRILDKLNKISHEPIIFYIQGIGGDAYAFMKLAHVIGKLESKVVFVAFDFVKSGCFWITQCGSMCLAVAGTKFIFHRAMHYLSRNTEMTQKNYLKGYDQLKLLDAMQFWIFTLKGTPVSTISRLFEREATISVEKAIKLKLVADIYGEDDFRRDRERADELARGKYKF